LSEGIRSNLLQKRDQLLAQIHRLEYRIEEIRYVKTIIERDARAEYGGIIERLKSAEGIKVAVL
jgi:palmitoyltransferase